MIDIVSLLVTIIIWGLVFYLLFWAIGKVGLPEPFGKIALVLLVLFAVLVLLNFLGVLGAPYLVRLR